VKRNSEGKSSKNTTFTPFFIISELRYAIINGNLFLIITPTTTTTTTTTTSHTLQICSHKLN
jgi:hypothetical protein